MLKTHCFKCGGELAEGMVPRNLPSFSASVATPRPGQRCTCNPIGGVPVWPEPGGRPVGPPSA